MLIREKIFALPIAVCLVLVQGVTSVLHPINTTIKSSSLRLPTAVLPLTYFLHITSHIHQDILDYSGRVIIDLDVNTTTNEIILHADKLWGFKISLTDLSNNHKYENLDHSHSNQTDFLRIFSSSEPLNLVAGERYRLEIAFGGLIHQPHFGFYRNSYKDENNKTIPIGTTQFEPTSARLAFPCFDEPSFKSTFVISITHGSNYTAISNMPVDGKPVMGPNGEMTTTTFRETPLMPTYLVAFVISNYEYISETSNNIEHRVFLPPHSIDRGQKALKNSIKSVNAIEKLFNVSYTLPKLDHIRLEKTYGSAMENWGLITYSKKNFIPSHENHNWHAKVKLIIVQNHEIAHQWFGNMVSPKWWTYAWLNEGFATYFAYVVTELVYPDWRVGDFFIDNEVDVTFSWPIDHAMTHYVETEADIKSVFDVVVYQKASCFIKMFHHAIGHNTFIKGLTMFLTKFQYSVADEEDLFRVLQEAVNEDEQNLFKEVSTLPVIMHTWTHNQGIPIVTVSRNYRQGTITIRQRSNTKLKNETWWIPLSFASASHPNFNQTTADYILPPEEEVTINLKDINIEVSDSDWLIVNKQQTGLYYVVYDDYNLNLIAEALNSDHHKIHYLNRALLFRDLASALHKDLQSTEALCVILQYLQVEEDWMVWKSAADLILGLRTNLYGSKAFTMYKTFIQDVMRPIFLKYQTTHKTEFAAADLSTRPKIVEAACHVDLPECLIYAKQLTIQYIFDGVKIDDAVSDTVMCQGIKYHNAEEFRRLVDKLVQSPPDSEIYDDIIYSIRCVESKENLNYFLELIFGENSTNHIMSAHESMQYLSFIYVSNYFSRPVVLDFMMNNSQKLCNKSTAVLATLERISNYVSDDDRQKEEFLKLLANVTEILKESNFEKIDRHKIGSRSRNRELFRQKHEHKLYMWLKQDRESRIIGQQEESTTSGESNQNMIPGVARYIVAAGLVSNLIGFV